MTSLSPLVVSVDELRAVHRLVGLCLPRFVVTDDEDDARVDAAAVRGLAARGLVDLQPDGSADDALLVTGPLDDLLGPGRAARWIAEIDVEVSGVLDRHAVIADDTGAAVVATELPGGLVALRPTGTDRLDEVRRLSRIDKVGTPALASPFTVDTEAHRDADELALGGDDTAAVRVLTVAGVAESDARAWITALCGHRCAAAVTVAHNLGVGPDGPFELVEARWLVAGDGTGWRVRAGEPPGHGEDGDVSADDMLSVLAPVSGDELREALSLTGVGVNRCPH